ncbi:ParA family protein [Rhizobium sp. G21]|uniref:ParA family protein n=1 Tax=Rhizobium sp. G21 TaxID=2758439 RepID=UPI0016021284|nr:ParA family protein [Rhizobium sp. G21]MBB1248218.1 ParA family protein [Rhizobium sp. G21]
MTINDSGSAAVTQPPITWVDVARRLSILEPTDPLWKSKPTDLLRVDVDWLSATFYVTDLNSKDAVLSWLAEIFPSRVNSGQHLLLDGPGTSSRLAIDFEEIEQHSARPRISLGNIEGKVSFESGNFLNASRAVPLIACHSVKGGTGRTTTAIALATLLAKRTVKPILVVDADLEAPGLSYLFRASRTEALVSLEDVVALAHAEGDIDYPQTVAWTANLLQGHRLGELVILPLRRMLGELASSAIRAEHLTSEKRPFALADLLEKIAITIGCGAVVIDVRAGLVPIAAQLVLDPSVSRVFVTSLAGQSLEATEGLIAFVAREMRKSQVSASPPLLVVNRIPGILRDLGQDEGILAPVLEQIERSLLAEYTQEAAPDEAVLDNAVELNPLFVAKLGEVSDLQTPSSRWEGFSSQLASSGFIQRLEPQIEAWLDLVFEGKDQISPALPPSQRNLPIASMLEGS